MARSSDMGFHIPDGVDRNCGIYMIKNTRTGAFYIGSTNDAPTRKCDHFQNLKRGKHNDKLQPAYDFEADKSVFKFAMFIYCAEDQLLAYEQSCIDCMNPEYNVSRIAGKVEMTDAIRLKISQKRTGQRAWNKGIPMTEEGKDNLRRKNTGKRHSEAVRAAARVRNKGEKNPNYGNGSKISGARNPNAVAVIELSSGKEFPCIAQAAKFFNVPPLSISMVCLGKQKTAGGLKFVRTEKFEG